jgi:hypothetical protein
MRMIAGAFSVLVLALSTSALFILPQIPPNWAPWAAPVLDAQPTWFAHFQINRLKFDHGTCLATLANASQIEFIRENDREMGVGCAYQNVVRATQLPVPFNYGPTATCPLTAALYWWLNDVQKIAEHLLQTSVARIEQAGTYSCRDVRSERGRVRSQHARANAIDIAAFVLSDGRRVGVREWNTQGSERDFLREAHAAACKYFNGTLGPDYNAFHADHFHLDVGPFIICR